jgi:glycosyltransferase involved in cell wall biosynthesis
MVCENGLNTVALLRKPLYMHMLRNVYKNANIVISPSASYCNLLRRVGIRNVINVPNLLARGEFEQWASNEFQNNKKENAILFVGRLQSGKGVELIPTIASQLPTTRFEVAGGGPLYDWLAKHNPGNLVLHGFLWPDKRRALMSKCSLLFVPSARAELYPTVVLEAFAAGKPAVAFDYCGAKEIIESSGGGLLATPFNVNSIVECINYLLENPDVQEQMGGRARKWACETVHPDIVIKKLIRIYENLASNCKSEPGK